MKTSNKVLYNQYIARWGLYFMLPSIALLFLFQLFPIVYSLFISFHEYDILSPPKFIGLKNFLSLKNDPLFISSVSITITYVFYTIVPVIGLSFFIAWSLTKILNDLLISIDSLDRSAYILIKAYILTTSVIRNDFL